MSKIVPWMILLPLAVWMYGNFSLYGIVGRTEYLIFFVSNAFLAVFLLLIWWRRAKKGSAPIYVSRGNRLVLATLLPAILTILFALIMYSQLIVVSKSLNFDDARFLVRASPFFGFASRIVYWWPIVVAPFALYCVHVNKKFLGWSLIILLMLSSMASGSKAGVVWFVVSMLLGLNVLKRNGLDTGVAEKILVVLSALSVVLMGALFFVFSEDAESAWGGFLFRVGYGAVEGGDFALKYYDEKGPTFPYFLVERPLELLATTFRIIEKNYFSGDTGVYLARYFGRENDNASYTISSVGLFYMEAGYFGIVIGVLVVLRVWAAILKKYFRSKSLMHRLYAVSWIIVFLHFLDWGWMDGILVFSIIYVALAQLVVRVGFGARIGVGDRRVPVALDTKESTEYV